MTLEVPLIPSFQWRRCQSMICQAAQAGCSNPNTTASDAFSSGTVIRSICNRAANGPSDAIFLR